MGDRMANLQQAEAHIREKAGQILAASSVYETGAWGNIPQPDFLNQVLLIETTLSATALLQQLMKIEQQMGRFREEKYGPRVIDIDILFFNDDIIRTNDLTIPHPRLHLRNFVLEPMNELAPNLFHPVLGKTISDLLSASPDTLDVKKFSPETE